MNGHEDHAVQVATTMRHVTTNARSRGMAIGAGLSRARHRARRLGSLTTVTLMDDARRRASNAETIDRAVHDPATRPGSVAAIDHPGRHGEADGQVPAHHGAAQAGRSVGQMLARAGRHREIVDVATIRGVEQEGAVTGRRMTIAIDGPAAAGKSTVGEIVARRIDGVYFDTGLLYRALTLLALERGISPADGPRLASLAASMDIEIARPTVADGRQVDVRLSGRDVTNVLRTPAIDQNVSEVSAHAAVRNALLEHQRRIARSDRVVMVGRDIGTVVLPDADLKIFLDASPEERARRRCLQLEATGKPQAYDDVLAGMRRRDKIDSERDVAPLRPAADAVVIDSDPLTVEEVADVIVRHAAQRLGAVSG